MMKDGFKKEEATTDAKKSPASLGTPHITSMFGGSDKQSMDIDASIIFKGTALFG
jgi:hypothetical protein